MISQYLVLVCQHYQILSFVVEQPHVHMAVFTRIVNEIDIAPKGIGMAYTTEVI